MDRAPVVMTVAAIRTPPAAAVAGIVFSVLFAASILLAPNVLPWYALWFLPLLVLRDSPGALLFTGTVQLAYLVYPEWLSGQRWQVSGTVRVLEYGPCLVVALVAWLRSRPAGGAERSEWAPTS